jgi:hypothetical protein
LRGLVFSPKLPLAVLRRTIHYPTVHSTVMETAELVVKAVAPLPVVAVMVKEYVSVAVPVSVLPPPPPPLPELPPPQAASPRVRAIAIVQRRYLR